MGDCDFPDGVVAPFDEENTEHIFKIEKLNLNNNLFDFWYEHANSDQYSNKEVEFQKFSNN